MSTTDSPTRTAAYTVAPALQLVIEKMRQGTISGPVDRDLLLRIGVKESLAKRTLNSLRTLGLINDDGGTTDEFDALINARPSDYETALADFLRQAYQHVFEVVDPSTASAEELHNAFWGYEPRGQIDAMIRLFVALCEEAGIIEKRPTAGSAKPQKSKGAGSRKKAAGKRGSDDAGRQDPPPPTDSLAAKRAEYADLLLAKVKDTDEPSADLLDRLERTLGIAESEGSS